MDMTEHEYRYDALDGLTPAQFYTDQPDYTPVSEHYSLDDAKESLESKHADIGGMIDPKVGTVDV